ncbi:hypothetical protein Baya_9128 [Bagarius yarrelli]|uniref:Uncharacterized protein n=1 Tax=Bagarius yarrelli TaxID=175774 RepID=A0A556U7I1_BAGYA|nr:hypothetical protein Baya_9128 [Bagarius yarrelli]
MHGHLIFVHIMAWRGEEAASHALSAFQHFISSHNRASTKGVSPGEERRRKLYGENGHCVTTSDKSLKSLEVYKRAVTLPTDNTQKATSADELSIQWSPHNTSIRGADLKKKKDGESKRGLIPATEMSFTLALVLKHTAEPLRGIRGVMGLARVPEKS